MANSPRRAVRAPRIMATAYRIDVRPDDSARMATAAHAGAAAPLAVPLDYSCATRSCDDVASVHIVGAGLAGLAAAVRLCRARRARDRSTRRPTKRAGAAARIIDPVLGITIDNGNHLLLSGNQAALGYLDTIGASDRLFGPSTASFPFIDLANKRALDAACQ